MKVVEAHAETADRRPTGDAVHAGSCCDRPGQQADVEECARRR
jgi:hypothetical protein